MSSDTPQPQSRASARTAGVQERASYHAADAVKPQIGQILGFVIDPRERMPLRRTALDKRISLASQPFSAPPSLVIVQGGSIQLVGLLVLHWPVT